MNLDIDKYFSYKHLPPFLQEVSKQFYDLAKLMEQLTPNNDEFQFGLRKLLEAKDCFVRAKL